MNRFAWKIGAAFILPGMALALSVALAQTPKGEAVSAADGIKFYEAQVKPVLKANCLSCHSANPSGGLRLTDRASILKGGANGPSVSLDKPLESLLVKAAHYDGRQMPPSGKMAQANIDVLTKWVQIGLPMTETKAAVDSGPVKKGPPPVNAETMRFWSFRPVKRPAPPKVKNAAWGRSPMDAFILSKLEAKHFTPAAPASKTVLLRRATYDLTGLPPTPAQVRAFLADTSPKAYEKVVDRLLASPQYGERWGRHWLDLVRYAESNSFERDNPKPFVWRYRDYVIKSFNDDKPYNQFIREQLAGDELPNATTETRIATGYYRLGTWDDEPSDPEQARYDELDDIVATTGQTFLGLTVNCARCHDHKLDPIPQKDYYRLLSFFQGTTRYGGLQDGRGHAFEENSLRPIAPLEAQKRYATETEEYKNKLADLEAQIKAIETLAAKDFSPIEKEEFRQEGRRIAIVKKRVPAAISEAQMTRYEAAFKQRDELRKAPPAGLEMALCITETPTIPASHVMLRGNPHVFGDEVKPAFISVLAPPAPVIGAINPDAHSSGRRLALADWIASPQNQLTARVMANRIWQYHFGRGIVRTSSNFGFQGSPPTHPELLDWLASELVRNNWKLKPLHRLIMLSSAYRMGSQADPKALAKDPENDLFWRFDQRRLDAEEIRDSILAANGSLSAKMAGPSVYPTLPAEVLAGQSMPGHNWNTSAPEEQKRRSVYIHIKRSVAIPLLASFDASDTDFACPVRFATTQPTQALGMLNSAFLNEQAQVFAESITKQAGIEPAKQVRAALWRVLQREPTAKEITRGVTFIQTMQTKYHATKPEALRQFCLIALNLNEFIYLD